MGRKSRRVLHKRGTVESRELGREMSPSKARRARRRQAEQGGERLTEPTHELFEPIFVPRLLSDGELPDMPEPLRQLVNLTAEGKPASDDLPEELFKDSRSLDQLYDAIREGIHRWHTPSKERE